MRLLAAITKLPPVLCSVRAARSAARAESEAVRISKEASELSDIKQKLPGRLLSTLRTDISIQQWRKVHRLTDAHQRIPEYLKNIDPFKVIPPEKYCVKALSVAKRKTGGRNFTGKICTRRIGGGWKRRVRILDRHRVNENPLKVVRIEHDPNRSAKLALLQDTKTERLSYVLAADGMAAGQVIENVGREKELTDANMIKPGACLPLREIPVGTRIHSLETQPFGGGKLVRAAGTSAILVGRSADLKECQVKLPSGSTKSLLADCRAAIGSVGNSEWHLRVIGKAGRSRNLGIRPHVRGVAMNAVDHPHGGGKGGRGKGKPSQSPWGKICK